MCGGSEQGRSASARPRDDAAAGLPHGRPARRLAGTRGAAAHARHGRRDAESLPHAATDGPRHSADLRALSATVCLSRQPRRPPAVLRLRPVRRHLARRARRLHRECQCLRLDVAPEFRRPVPSGARGARLVQGVARLSADGVRAPGERRLGGQHDGSGVRARTARRTDADDLVAYVLRPGALLDRAGRADARLPTRPGARPPASTSASGSTRQRSAERSKPTRPPAAGRSSSP